MHRPCPTPRLLVAAAALAALGATVPWLPFVATPWRAALLLLVLALILELALRPRGEVVTVERRKPRDCRVGYPLSYRTTITNTGRTTVRVLAREVAPLGLDSRTAVHTLDLEPGARHHYRTSGVPLERGPLTLLPVGIGIRQGLGLLEFRSVHDEGRVLAIKPGRPTAEQAVLLSRVAALEQPGQTPLRRLGGEWEFESLREYQVGDEPRMIDWRASARRHLPVTRQYEVEHASEIVLALDVGRLMGARVDGLHKADLAAVGLLDLAATACQHGERVGLLVFDSEPRAYLPPRAGWRHVERMTDELAGIAQRDTTTSFLRAVELLDRRHQRRCLCVLFTDFLDEITGLDMFASLGAIRRRHELLFVGLGDPQVTALLDTPAPSDTTLFEKSIAAQLVVERARALRRFEENGVHVVDADPRRLSAPLIRRYLSMRYKHPLTA